VLNAVATIAGLAGTMQLVLAGSKGPKAGSELGSTFYNRSTPMNWPSPSLTLLAARMHHAENLALTFELETRPNTL
jgi:hypothetical protein